ncbi:hypothetical protein [Miniphocaeibacter massiliensis]|uniref:hypothetical protein n=1 Tax=Miniphocaeibacter massiliensis TaxID=2041841 RepID=UPI000C1C0E51|nr:hypothetical protein [Miniphocaeibacter massiliensis]
MKKFIGLFLVIGGLLAGTCLIYGVDCEKPEGYNLTVINNTGVKFSHIGFGNEKFTSILSDAKKDYMDKFSEQYFHLKDLDKNNIWTVKAVGEGDEVFDAIVEIEENGEIVLEEVKGNRMVTNKNIELKNKFNDFDILKMIEDWNCKVKDDKIISEYEVPFIHSTSVMGKNGEVITSDAVSKNSVAKISEEKGNKGYSWINIYH